MVSDRWIERALYNLAGTGWGSRRTTATEAFTLKPESLPLPTDPAGMASVVSSYYSHARDWAPGFQIPSSVPKVSVSGFVESAGQYQADAQGRLHIEIAPGFRGSPSAILVILAHEACHHILDLSSVKGATSEENEILTDLAMFICGFGEIVLRGVSEIRGSGSDSVAVHLGYLNADQYRFAYNWVLRVQGLPVPERLPPADARTVGPRTQSGLVLRLIKRLKWFLRRREPCEATHVRAPVISEGTNSPFSDPLAVATQTALARLGGNRSTLERLIEYERSRHPHADELTLLDAVIESLERDRR